MDWKICCKIYYEFSIKYERLDNIPIMKKDRGIFIYILLSVVCCQGGNVLQKEECIIVGAGPCGLAAAIALKDMGKNPVIIEKENIVHSLYKFPTHQTFFSTSDRLEIGNVPFITENRKPTRNQALAYYREVTRLKNLRVNAYEEVLNIMKQDDGRFYVRTTKDEYTTKYVIVATGYYDNPNYMNIPGKICPKCSITSKSPSVL